MSNLPDQNQQFEHVLSRLDALMKRGHAPDAPPVPPSQTSPPATENAAAEALPQTEVSEPDHTSIPFVILEEPAEIPVLTEIYEGETPSGADSGNSELAEAVVDALLPMMLENLDRIVAEEAARMQQNIADRLRKEIAVTLRDRLQ